LSPRSSALRHTADLTRLCSLDFFAQQSIADRPHGDNFGGGALTISHNLFADGDDDAFPADHRSKSKRECDRKLHSVRIEFRGATETLFVGAERRYLGLRKIAFLVFLQETDRLGGEIHIVACIADGFGS
jgi:hypothetical protein